MAKSASTSPLNIHQPPKPVDMPPAPKDAVGEIVDKVLAEVRDAGRPPEWGGPPRGSGVRNTIVGIVLAALSAGGSAWYGMKAAIDERPTEGRVIELMEAQPALKDQQRQLDRIEVKVQAIDDKVDLVREDIRDLRRR